MEFREIDDFSEVRINEGKLAQWRDNSLRVARDLGYNQELLENIRDKVKLEVTESTRLENVWYGVCYFDQRKISVLRENITTQPLNRIIETVIKAGVSEDKIPFLNRIIKNVGMVKFAEITNQSGMDHEIIGHMYNFLAGQPCDELAAVKTQLEMAKFRSEDSLEWEEVLKIMPLILSCHKSVDI